MVTTRTEFIRHFGIKKEKGFPYQWRQPLPADNWPLTTRDLRTSASLFLQTSSTMTITSILYEYRVIPYRNVFEFLKNY